MESPPNVIAACAAGKQTPAAVIAKICRDRPDKPMALMIVLDPVLTARQTIIQ